MLTGKELAWDAFGSINPGDVCRRAEAAFDRATQYYHLKFFSQHIHVSAQPVYFRPGEERGVAAGATPQLRCLGFTAVSH